MRKSLLLLSICALLAVETAWAAGPQNRARLPGIYGKDDRHIIEEMGPPWSAIGRINRRTGGFCTATLIAPDKVLTAAHCMWNKRTHKWLRPDGLHFLPGYRMGSYLLTQAVASIRLDPDIAMDERGRPRDMAKDWAVLTLKAAIPPSKELQPIALASNGEIAAIAPGQPLVRAGYSQDRPHLPTKAACHLLGRSGPRIILHDCDGTRGDSGSPILIQTDGGWRVLGLHVAVAARGTESFGIGVLTPDFLHQ